MRGMFNTGFYFKFNFSNNSTLSACMHRRVGGKNYSYTQISHITQAHKKKFFGQDTTIVYFLAFFTLNPNSKSDLTDLLKILK